MRGVKCNTLLNSLLRKRLPPFFAGSLLAYPLIFRYLHFTGALATVPERRRPFAMLFQDSDERLLACCDLSVSGCDTVWPGMTKPPSGGPWRAKRGVFSEISSGLGRGNVGASGLSDTKNPPRRRVLGAERPRFELGIRFWRIHAFQACFGLCKCFI